LKVQDLKLDDFARGKLDITTKELLEEKDEAMTVCNAN
jgi:malate dehydrogenase